MCLACLVLLWDHNQLYLEVISSTVLRSYFRLLKRPHCASLVLNLLKFLPPQASQIFNVQTTFSTTTYFKDQSFVFGFCLFDFLLVEAHTTVLKAYYWLCA